MAVKTITIDLEAYELLARRKKLGQSFSQVIKEHLGRRTTGRDLLAHAERFCLSDPTLEAIEKEVKRRRRNPARVVRL